jgi:hypothetical protein
LTVVPAGQVLSREGLLIRQAAKRKDETFTALLHPIDAELPVSACGWLPERLGSRRPPTTFDTRYVVTESSRLLDTWL